MFHSPSFFLYHIMQEDKKHEGKGKRRVRTMLFPASLNHRGMEKSSGVTGRGLKQKICKVDPLIYPKCQGTMRNIDLIEDGQVIQSIIGHLVSECLGQYTYFTDNKYEGLHRIYRAIR
jgi:hypothetical protein